MKHLLFTILTALAFVSSAFAQNNVGINNTAPDASAALDVTSTTQGMLVPRMTKAQRDVINMVGAISTPAVGLLIYQVDNTPGFYFYNGTAWTSLSGGGGGTTLPSQAGNAGKVLTTNGTNLSWGSATSYELHVTKTSSEAQTTSVGSSLSLPDVITFSNTSADATNAPLSGTAAPYSTANGTWNGALGKFTATNSGLYFVDVQLVSGITYCVPMLDFNGTGNSSSSYYGVGMANTSTFQTPHRGRGTLQRLVWMNATDYFIVRGTSGTTAVGADLTSNGTTYIKVSRLR